MAAALESTNKIVFKTIYGKKKVQDTLAADSRLIPIWPHYESRYNQAEIYNCDKTGIYFKAIQDKTICFSDEHPTGGKKMMDKLTVLLLYNTNGSDKQQLLVIGSL